VGYSWNAQKATVLRAPEVGDVIFFKDGPESQIDKQSNNASNKLFVYFNKARCFGPFFWPYQANS